jgi:hypothetical protein
MLRSLRRYTRQKQFFHPKYNQKTRFSTPRPKKSQYVTKKKLKIKTSNPVTLSDKMDIDLGLLFFIILSIISIIIALIIVKKFNIKPHKTLTNLVAANIFLDLIAVAIWALFPDFRWTIYNLDFLTVSVEAAIASGLFAITLFGLKKTKKWAPILAIAITISQRAFANYVFFLSIMNVITLVWSLLIICFAYLTIKQTRILRQSVNIGYPLAKITLGS